jgi:curli biogenesis system outer membrane secretion channel CsgG
MKEFLLTSIIVVFSFCALAQPNYSLDIYRVSQGQKANYYNRQAKSFIKNGKLVEGAMNAAMGLKLADNKSKISSAQEHLNESYSRAISESKNRIALLEVNTESFSGDQTVTDQAEVVRLYKAMHTLNLMIKDIPPASLKPAKKKDQGFNPELEEFTAQISVAQENFDESKELAAVMHYNEGRELESKGGKLNSRMAAKRYTWANQYSPGYRDAMDRYDEVKKLGTTRMGLMKFESARSQYGDLGAIVTDNLLDLLASKAASLEFFEVIDRNQVDQVINEQQLALSGLMDESTTADIGELQGVDVLLVGNITKNFIDRQKSGPETKTYSKSVKVGTETYLDSKGKEKTRDVMQTVNVEAKIHTKRAEAIVGGSFKVLDVKSGQLLLAGTATGSDDWSIDWIGEYTGDARALPSLARKEPAYPSYDKLINNATNHTASQIFGDLVSYAEKVGR